MENLLVNIYRYLSKRIGLFVVIALGFLGVCAYFASQLSFEENISKMLPDKAEIMQINKTIESSGFMDRLFVHVYSDSPNPEGLTQYADSFATQLLASPDSGLIRSLEVSLSSEDENAVFEFVKENLPLLLEEEDFVSIEEKLDSSSIATSLDAGYQLLLSPAGAWSGPQFRKDPLNLTSIGLSKLNKLRLDDNIQLYNGYYLSKDQKHLLMWLIPSNEATETTENARLLETMKSIFEEMNTGEIKAEYFGTTAVAVGNARQIKRDIQTTVAIAFTLLLIFLTFYFRKPLTILYLFTPVIFGAGLALAVLYLVKGSISAISLGIGSIIVGITIDFSLHFLNHFKEENDTLSVLRATSRPILTSCLTTASAFLCLTLVESDSLTDLGIFAGISVIGAALATLLVLSQLIKPSKKPLKSRGLEKGFDRLSSYPLHKNKWALLGVLAITIICFFFYKQVRFDGDMQKMNYMSEEMVQAQARLNQVNQHSDKTIYAIARSNSLEEALQANDKLGIQLEALLTKYPTLKAARSSSILISEEEQETRIERWNAFWSEARKQTLKQQLIDLGSKYRFKENTFNPFFDALNLAPTPYSYEEIASIKALNVEAFGGSNEDLQVFFNPVKVSGVELQEVKDYLKSQGVFVFDKAEFANSIVQSLQSEFSSLIWASLILVFLLLMGFYRHSLLALLTLTPILISWVWVTGIMVIFDLQFNIFNIIVSSLIFGLGIDYAIFISSGLMHELRTGEQKINVYKTSILLSALTTICGVGALIFAKHPALHSMAVISILGIGVAVLISFSLQAFLIRLLIVNRSQRGFEPFTTFTLLATIWTFLYFLVGCLISFLLGYLILPLIPVKKERKVSWVTWFSSKWVRSLTDHQRQIKQSKNFPSKERLKKPSVIIMNHESFLDILITLGMSSKNILLTNDWVYNSPFFGKVVQYVGFYPVSQGFEQALPHLQKKVDQGYTICVFPEGTRSRTPMLSRFHKGAFYIAEQLKLDIVPVILHGYGHIMSKGDDFLLKIGRVKTQVLPTIEHGDENWGKTERERYKNISRFYKESFYKLRREEEDLSYYRLQLKMNYRYKGIDLEKEAKGILHENESLFNAINDQLPERSKTLVIGDRLGLLALFLTYLNDRRHVLGLFQEESDLVLAKHCFSYLKNEQSNFLLLHDEIDYTGIDRIVIATAMAGLSGENLNYVIRECYEHMSESCSLILAHNQDLQLELGQQDRLSSELIQISKTIG